MEIIIIQNNLSLLQIKSWSYLHFKVFQTIYNSFTFTVTYDELREHLGDKNITNKEIGKVLRSLLSCILRWKSDISENSWTATTLISWCKSDPRSFSFGFSEFFREKLNSYNLFIKLNMLIQNQFSSKHSRLLYGLCLEYYNIDTNSAIITYKIDELRKIFNLDKNEYILFREFNRSILKKAIEEINDKSNLNINIDYLKDSNQVVAVKLQISLDKTNLMDFPMLTPSGETPPKVSLHISAPDKKFKNFLVKYCIPMRLIKQNINTLKDNGIDRAKLNEYLLYIKELCEKNKVVTSELFVELLTQKVHIESFLQKVAASNSKNSEIYEHALLTFYESYKIVKAIEFLKANKELFYQLIEKNMDNIQVRVFKILLTHDDLVSSFGVIEKLLPDLENIEEYPKTTFEEWKTDIKNKSIIDSIIQGLPEKTK